MYELEVETIQDYIDQCLFEPDYRWPKLEFERRSYSRWAASEILNRVQAEKDGRKVIDIIKEFLWEMDCHSEIDYDRHVAFIFETARETAEDISFLFERGYVV